MTDIFLAWGFICWSGIFSFLFFSFSALVNGVNGVVVCVDDIFDHFMRNSIVHKSSNPKDHCIRVIIIPCKFS